MPVAVGWVFFFTGVSFVVSKGPVLVKVPSVAYKNVETATKLLKDEGFKVKVDDSRQLLGLVYRTDPRGGTEAPEGSTVTIFVG